MFYVKPIANFLAGSVFIAFVIVFIFWLGCVYEKRDLREGISIAVYDIAQFHPDPHQAGCARAAMNEKPLIICAFLGDD